MIQNLVCHGMRAGSMSRINLVSDKSMINSVSIMDYFSRVLDCQGVISSVSEVSIDVNDDVSVSRCSDYESGDFIGDEDDLWS